MTINKCLVMTTLWTIASVTLTACVSLPEDSRSDDRHYLLLPADGDCRTEQAATINLTMAGVAPGLAGERLLQVDMHSAQLHYLSNMRWVVATPQLIEQRLAADLERAGFSVATGSQQLAATAELNCELRAFNLEHREQQHSARFALSCLLYRPGDKNFQALSARSQQPVSELQAGAVIGGLGAAYSEGFNELCSVLAADQ